jgi:hypothetical protein
VCERGNIHSSEMANFVKAPMVKQLSFTYLEKN